MRCGVLGPLEVHADDGTRVSVPGAKERLLLAVLAADAPHVVSVDRLVEELWSGQPPRTAVKSLQAHVVRLRTALEPGRPVGSPGQFVVRRQAGYALVVEDGQLDARQLTELSARGRALLTSGDDAAAAATLAQALALWRGTPYADWPDADFAAAERSRLEGVLSNTTGWSLEARLALGQHAEVIPELQRLVADNPTREQWWSLLALALYRSGRQGDALGVLRKARTVLADELGVDPGPELVATEEGILRQDPVLDVPHPEDVSPLRGSVGSGEFAGCPYKGLAAYQFEDRGIFHGRDRLVSRLVGALVDSRLLVVAGSSGVGKSSLVRAGLLPALADGALPGSQEWSAVVITPGSRPADALAGMLREGEEGAPPRLLVCDQLEEIWSPAVDPPERAAFLDALLGLLDDDDVTRCVLAVRGDHVGRLAEHPSMADRLIGALTLVPPLGDAEVREVVEGPAASAGLAVESDLVDAVLRDVVGRAGALPLLSAALVGTWERRRGSLLTLAGYFEAGGVAGAVAAAAEEVYAGFDEEAREAARQVLVRLADQDDQGAIRRRRVPMDEIDLAGDPASRHRMVVETLVRHRLLTLDRDHVEVAHEALLVAWPRLARWLEEDSVGRVVRHRLSPDAVEWDREGRPQEHLYRGARLQASADWADDPRSGATALEREFVAAGGALAEQELRDARDRAATEAAARRRTWRLAAGLAAFLVAALVATGVAVVFQRSADRRAGEAEDAHTVADANRLAAQASGARSLDLSLLLAANALRTAVTPATEDGLLNGLLVHRRATEVHAVPTGVAEMSLSMDGRTGYATVGGATPRVVSWQIGRASTPRLLVNWLPDSISAAPDGRSVAAAGAFAGAMDRFVPPEGEPYLVVYARDGGVLREWAGFDALGGIPGAVRFTPAGKLRLVTSAVGKDAHVVGTLREVDVASGRVHVIRRVGRTPGMDAGLASSFTPDASRVVTWRDDDHTDVRMYDVRSGRLTAVRLARRSAQTLDFVALPGGVMQLWSDGAMTRYDARGRAVQTMDVHSPPVGGVLVLPDGRRAVTAGGQGEVWLWAIQPDGEWTAVEQLPGHTGNVYLAAAGGVDGRVMTAAEDGTLIGWDLDGEEGFGSPYPDLGERWISNRLEVVAADRLVVAPARSLDRTVATVNGVPLDAVFLDPRTGEEVATVPVGATRAQPSLGGSVSVSPDGRLVAVTTIWRTKVINVRKRKVVATIKLPPLPPAYLAELPNAAVWASAWSPDGSRLLLGTLGSSGTRSRDNAHTVLGDLVVVDTTSWRVERRVVVPGGIRVLQWSPDRTVLAVGQAGIATVTLFDSSLRQQRVVELRPSDYPFDLAFSADGSRLAVGGAEGRVSVLDTATWELVHEPALVQGARIVDVAWLPDGRTVVASGEDERASLYDSARNMVRAGPFPASDQPPDGRGYAFVVPGADDELVLAGGDQPGRRIPLDPAVWLATACRIAGRDLTRDEWRTYLPDRPYRRTCLEILGR